jgi:hypothetical protein
VSFLRAQIERAKRFAAAMTNPNDREHFEGRAEEYQRELDALSASSEAKSADTSTPSPDRRDRDASAATPAPDTAAPPDAVASTDDSAPTTSNDTGQQETD